MAKISNFKNSSVRSMATPSQLRLPNPFMGGFVFIFRAKLGLKCTKNVRFCILFWPIRGGSSPPPPPPPPLLVTLLVVCVYCSTRKMLKETETIHFLSHFCHWLHFNCRGSPLDPLLATPMLLTHLFPKMEIARYNVLFCQG